jgi:hypothetical protein
MGEVCCGGWVVAALLLCLAVAIGPREDVAYCDLVEVNHYYKEGRLQFTQLIFYDWNARYRRFDALRIDPASMYIIVQEDQFLQRLPKQIGDSYHTKLPGDRHAVVARMHIETRTTYDREAAKRDLVKIDDRRVLFAK